MEYKEYGIKKEAFTLMGKKFKVVEKTCFSGKPAKVLKTKTLFVGSILECDAYLRLLEKGILI